jgi:hypothetical protein
MSKYTHSQVLTVSLYMRTKGYDQVADMLGELSAHLAAQAEWPSEEDVARVAQAAWDAAQSDVSCRGNVVDAVRAALAEVGHGRPAQEKATNYVSGRTDSTGKFHATAQEKAEPAAMGSPSDSLPPCPFCRHAGPFDRWPCEWLDASGANVVRCPMCRGAAPEATWRRAARRAGLSPVALASIGRGHFGNPIPRAWYAAARELIAVLPAQAGGPPAAGGRSADVLAAARRLQERHRASMPEAARAECEWDRLPPAEQLHWVRMALDTAAAVDVAAVRDVISECRRPMPRVSGKGDYYEGYDEAMSDVADQLAKIIGDAK